MARTSDIDFDRIPSPRPNTSLQRNGVLRPSSASFDDYAPQESPPPAQSSPRRKSFGVIEQEEEEEEEEPLHETPSKKGKGKRKTPYEEPDQDTVEDEIAQELEDVGLDSDDNEELPPSPDLKKAQAERKNPPTKTKTQSKTKKENREPRQGVRRSQREHYRPLEYWRGEKLVYGRTHNAGSILVPQIKEIIRIPKEVPVPFGVKRKRGSTRARSHSKTLEAVEGAIPPALPVVNPEEGWDDETEAKCTVIHFPTKEEVERRQ